MVCTREEDRRNLQALLENGIANGVEGLRIVEREELLAMEPNISDEAVAALYAPTGGIPVSYTHLDVYKRQPLEWMGRMLAADGRITEWIWNQAYPQYMTRANPGGWIRSLFAGEGENGIPDPDPAYRELVRNRQFLEEHPYIKQRLAQAVGRCV